MRYWIIVGGCALACSTAQESSTDTEPGDDPTPSDLPSQDILVPRAPIDPALFPRADDGNLIVAELGPLQLRVDPQAPPNPMSIRVACQSSLQHCYESTRDMDSCVTSSPNCLSSSAGPSTCCPEPCLAEYTDRRSQGSDPLAAWVGVFGTGSSCIPGYADWVNGRWP